MCEPYYHTHLGRPSIPPGVYFRMLLVGYYEGIGSQRGIAWRCGDSLSLREFLGIPLTEETPDHSSLTRVRDRLPLEVHAAVFQWVLALAAEKKIVAGQNGGGRCHDLGSRCGHEVDRAARHRRGLERVSAAFAQGASKASKTLRMKSFAASTSSGRTSGFPTKSGCRKPTRTAALRR